MFASIINIFLNNYIFILLLVGMFILLICNQTIIDQLILPLWVGLGLITFLFIVESLEQELRILAGNGIIHSALLILSCVFRPWILLIFIYTILPEEKQERRFELLHALPLLFNAIYYLILFLFILSGRAIWEGQLTFGRIGFVCLTVFSGYLIYFLYLVFINFGKNKENILLVYCVICCLISGFLEIRGYENLLNSTGIISFIFYFIFAYVKMNREAIEKKDKALHEQETALVLSQIQPHFLYNSLTTIKSLCETDPELAGDTILHFSRYLRQNMDSITNKEPILLEKELEHVKNFVAIQEIRFDNFEMRYDIKEKNFSLPALSLQPLVENAISHGIRSKEHGTITIKSYAEELYYVVMVSDDGVGFDLTELKKQTEERSHVGIHNVKERIERIMNGKFAIVSKIGQGTICIIKIPKQ